MKKIILMAVAMLSMTTATFAANEENEAAEVYNMNVNMGSLASALNLTIDQVDAVADVNKNFSAEMMNAASASKDERQALVKKAIDKDLQYMHTILDKEQYRKYVVLLNTTINNRGLNK